MSDTDLGRSIYNNALPGLVRDYLSLVHGAEDPEIVRRAIELGYKLNEKSGAPTGVMVNVVFDMATGVVQATQAEIPAAVEVIEALPAASDDPTIDLSALLAPVLDEPAEPVHVPASEPEPFTTFTVDEPPWRPFG